MLLTKAEHENTLLSMAKSCWQSNAIKQKKYWCKKFEPANITERLPRINHRGTGLSHLKINCYFNRISLISSSYITYYTWAETCVNTDTNSIKLIFQFKYFNFWMMNCFAEKHKNSCRICPFKYAIFLLVQKIMQATVSQSLYCLTIIPAGSAWVACDLHQWRLGEKYQFYQLCPMVSCVNTNEKLMPKSSELKKSH